MMSSFPRSTSHELTEKSSVISVLNKSRFVKGRRCGKAFYLDTYSPHLKLAKTSLEQKTLSAGKAIGLAARKVFPDGLLITTLNTSQALQETKQAIEDGALTLFEAAFFYDDVLIRVDIFSRETVESPWDFYEVKATTYNDCTKEQKDEYRSDIAIQIWVLQNLGIPLRRISLMHLNRECRYPDLNDLFEYQDYSLEIAEELSEVEFHLLGLRDVLSRKEEL